MRAAKSPAFVASKAEERKLPSEGNAAVMESTLELACQVAAPVTYNRPALILKTSTVCSDEGLPPDGALHVFGRKPLACCVHGCPVNSRNAKHLSFFRFPSDRQRSQLWAKFSRRKSVRGVDCGTLHESESLRICSAHFKITDFTNPFVRSKLTVDAVPSVFDVSTCPWYLAKDYALNSSVRFERAVCPENLSAEEVPFMWDSVLDSEMQAIIFGTPESLPRASSISSSPRQRLLSPATEASSAQLALPSAVDYSDLCAYHQLFVRSVTIVGTEVEELKFCAKCGASMTDPVKLAANVYQIKCRRGHSLLVTNELNERCHEWLSACHGRHRLQGLSAPPVHSPCHLCDDHFVPPHRGSFSSFMEIISPAVVGDKINACNKFRQVRQNGLPQTFPSLVRHALRFPIDVATSNASVGCHVSTKEASTSCDDASTSNASVGCRVSTNNASVGCELVSTVDASVGICEASTSDASVGCDASFDFPPDKKKGNNKKQLNGDSRFSAALVDNQRKVIGMLKTRLIALNKTAETLRKQVIELNEWNISEDAVIEKVLPNYLSGVSLKLVETQVRLAKKKRMQRWPPFIVALGKVIYNESPAAYNIVRQLWNFPCKETLRKLPPLPNEMLSLKRYIKECFDGVSLIQERPDPSRKRTISERSHTAKKAVKVEQVPVCDDDISQMMASDDELLVGDDHLEQAVGDDVGSLSTADEAAIAADYLLNSEVPFANEEITTTTTLMDDMPIFMDSQPYNELEVQTSLGATQLPEITLDNNNMIVYTEPAEDGSLVLRQCQILDQFENAPPNNPLAFHSSLVENISDSKSTRKLIH